ncbi:MAG: hypothetical protein JJT75_10405 [Opitutales bacterium]|nr:hypothetical protein [Opitutales bacterium]MCH8540726.1 hypothetical protein [Opitutales bacterium]
MTSFFRKGDYWFGFATTKLNKKGQSVVRLVWGRILAALALTGLAGWIALTLAGFFFVRHQMDFKEGNYLNVVFPWRWDAYRESLGDAHVQKAFEALETQDWRNFHLYLRRGLAHSPGNMEGRRLLAELELSRNATMEAATILKRGLDFEKAYESSDYLQFSLPVFLRAGEEETIFALLEESAERDFPTEIKQNIALFASRAAWQIGNIDLAREFLHEYGLMESADGMVFALRLDWEQGQYEAVLSQLQQWLEQSPRNENLLQLKINFLMERGNWDEARQWAILYNLRHPESSRPARTLMELDLRLGNKERLQREFLNLLRSDESAETLRALGGVVRESRDPSLGQLFLDHLEEDHQERLLAILVALEAALATQAQDRAEEWFSMAESHPEIHNHPARQAYFHALAVVWHQWQENDADANSSLNSLLSAIRTHPEPALRAARLLTEQGHPSPALRILREGQRRHPLSQEFVSAEANLHITTGNFDGLISVVEQLVEMRRPDSETLKAARKFLQSDRFFFRTQRQEILQTLADKT